MSLSILRSVIRLSVRSSDGPGSTVDSFDVLLLSPHSPQLALADEYVSSQAMAIETLERVLLSYRSYYDHYFWNALSLRVDHSIIFATFSRDSNRRPLVPLSLLFSYDCVHCRNYFNFLCQLLEEDSSPRRSSSSHRIGRAPPPHRIVYFSSQPLHHLLFHPFSSVAGIFSFHIEP